ncbi:MAG: DNA gyrase inhibitor YacG [Bdellovibrionales bacterium]
MTVKCPCCSKPTDFDANNPFRPFCSERCSLLDLGAWADEKYKVHASDEESDSVNENSEPESGDHEISPPKHRLN